MTNKQAGNLYVIGQFALIIGLAVLPSPENWSNTSTLGIIDNAIFALGWLVLIVAILNLGRSLTANPVPLERATLKTGGLYGVVRHPIYLGLIIIAFSMALKSESLLGGLLFVVLVLLLNFKASFEEKLLGAKFPEYADYASRVGRLFPGVGKINHQGKSPN